MPTTADKPQRPKTRIKKCQATYEINPKDLWCKKLVNKKACTQFVDSSSTTAQGIITQTTSPQRKDMSMQANDTKGRPVVASLTSVHTHTRGRQWINWYNQHNPKRQTWASTERLHTSALNGVNLGTLSFSFPTLARTNMTKNQTRQKPSRYRGMNKSSNTNKCSQYDNKTGSPSLQHNKKLWKSVGLRCWWNFSYSNSLM